jgi:hypothetical protein
MLKHQQGISTLIIFVLLCLPINTLAQQKKQKVKGGAESESKQKTFVTAGIDASFMIPSDFGSRIAVSYKDTLFKLVPQLRFKLGMCVRTDFSKRFSFQTGIYYVERVYEGRVGKANQVGDDFQSLFFSNQIKYTGFEIPLMGLFYVQLGERWFLNNLVGLSLEFFPSATQKLSPDSTVQYDIYAARNSWIVPAAKAAVGFEYRSETAGYFYLGGQFHRPFFNIFDGYIEGRLDSPFATQTAKLPATGTYFSVDLKYFFPTGKKNKFLD